MILNSETVDNLTDNDHYQNLLKILNWDGYSRWDEYEREKLHCLHMYTNFVIEKHQWQNLPIGSDFDTFCREIL